MSYIKLWTQLKDLLYDRTSTCDEIDEGRNKTFANKSNVTYSINHRILGQHVKERHTRGACVG